MRNQVESQPVKKPDKGADRKKPYRKPVLSRYGDIRTQTLGPTPIMPGESGTDGLTYTRP